MLTSPKFLFRDEPDPANVAPGAVYPDQRPRARLAAVVLPVEQRPGRPAADRRRAGQAQGSGGARASGPPDAGGSAIESAGRQLRGAVALRAQSSELPARHGHLPELRRQPASGVPAGERAVLRERHARGSERARSADGGLHVRQRAARAALRHPERLRQPLPPRDAARREPARSARPGQRARGDVVSQPHVSGAARQVDSGEHSRHAAATAAAQRADAQGKQRGRQGVVGPRAAGGAPQESGVRDLSPRDGSARLLARQLRCDRRMANEGGRGRPGRRDRASWPTARRSMARWRCETRCSSTPSSSSGR